MYRIEIRVQYSSSNSVEDGMLTARLLVQILAKKQVCVAVIFIAESFTVSDYEYSTREF